MTQEQDLLFSAIEEVQRASKEIELELKARANTSWCPSNGEELSVFIDEFCGRCQNDKEYWKDQCPENACPIAARMLICRTSEDPNYPDELKYDAEGFPTCTAFEEIDGA